MDSLSTPTPTKISSPTSSTSIPNPVTPTSPVTPDDSEPPEVVAMRAGKRFLLYAFDFTSRSCVKTVVQLRWEASKDPLDLGTLKWTKEDGNTKDFPLDTLVEISRGRVSSVWNHPIASSASKEVCFTFVFHIPNGKVVPPADVNAEGLMEVNVEAESKEQVQQWLSGINNIMARKKKVKLGRRTSILSPPSAKSSSSSPPPTNPSSELISTLENLLSQSQSDLSSLRSKLSKLTDDSISFDTASDDELAQYFGRKFAKVKEVPVEVRVEVEKPVDNKETEAARIAREVELQKLRDSEAAAKEAALKNLEKKRQEELAAMDKQTADIIRARDNEHRAAIESAAKERKAAEDSLKAQIESERKLKDEANDALSKSEAVLKKKDAELTSVSSKAKEKLAAAGDAIAKLKDEYLTVQKKLFAARSATQEVEAKYRAVLSNVQKANENNKNAIEEIRKEAVDIPTVIQSFESTMVQEVTALIARKRGEMDALLAAYRKEVALRKQLFNQIQELRGNIRVYCRVRPLSQREVDDGKNAVTIAEEDDQDMQKLNIENSEKGTSNAFEFERIFRPTSTQMEVFQEVSDLVTSVMDGYNVCIFAYGQTGSGKTYTMEGPKEDPGVNLRTLARLFEIVGNREAELEYQIKVSLLEIYNEKIQDLLNPDGTKVLKAVAGQYGMEVPELTMVAVSNQSDVLDTLHLGRKNRKVASTAMNDASSRSHLILSVYVLGKNKLTKKENMGKLHLIDLAGSERISRSGVTGDALKEAQAINSSLSALGNCIAARGAKQSHVPYRDSQLTYLLQDSLEKNSKTLMFVQISPNSSDSGESICSLRFAERVKKVELGKASTNVVAKDSKDGTSSGEKPLNRRSSIEGAAPKINRRASIV